MSVTEPIVPISSPPNDGPAGRVFIDEVFGSRLLRPGGFWGGRGGMVITILVMLLVVALLVGWVLLWLNRPEPSIVLLTLGCVAFSLVLMTLALIQNRLTTYWRLREAQAAYLAGVSHNLRTPISAIRAAAQALEQPGIDDETQTELLEGIVHETRLLGLRVDNVLETGRLEVERTAFMDTPVHLSAMILEAVNAISHVVKHHGGTLTSEIDDECWVYGDLRALRLVVDNLLDNAVKYRSGPPSIRVELTEHDQHILFRVIDSGVGLSEKEVARAFKRFWRGSTERSGTGLGLSLAQAIARGHGGRIFLHSEGHGHGAIAELWLRAADTEEA